MADQNEAAPIYWVGGSKSGIGRSMLTMVVVDYLSSRGESLQLVDCEAHRGRASQVHGKEARPSNDRARRKTAPTIPVGRSPDSTMRISPITGARSNAEDRKALPLPETASRRFGRGRPRAAGSSASTDGAWATPHGSTLGRCSAAL